MNALILALLTAASAGKLSIRSEVSNTHPAVGENISLDIVVTSATDDPVYNPPEFQNLDVVRRGTQHSQSFQMVMGSAPKVQRTTTYQYVLQASRPGPAKIGSATARAGSDLASSDPISLDVSGTANPQAQQQQQLPKAIPQGQVPSRSESVMLRVIPDKFDAFVGEQVVLSVFLLSRVELSDVNNLTQPQLEGVLLERDDKPRQNLVPRIQRFGSEDYQVFEIARFALFALREGAVNVGGFQLEAAGGVSFFSHGKTYRVTSPAVEIKAKALPTQGRPNNFTAMNVGDLTFNAQIVGSTAQVGKPVTLRMGVSGIGNPTKVLLPTPVFSDKLKAYDPETKSEQKFEKGQLTGRIVRDHLFVPLQPGQHLIPPVVFNSFDPQSGTYKEQRAGPFTINVTGEAQLPSQPANITQLGPEGRSLHPMRYASTLLDDRPRLQTVTWVWGGAGTSFAAAAVVLARRVRRREKSRAEVAREARAKASRELRALRGEKSSEALYGAITRVIRDYLQERFDISLGTARESLRGQLLQQGCDEGTVDRLLSELDNCDFARFAPGGDSSAQTQAAIERSDVVLAALDRAKGGV